MNELTPRDVARYLNGEMTDPAERAGIEWARRHDPDVQRWFKALDVEGLLCAAAERGACLLSVAGPSAWCVLTFPAGLPAHTGARTPARLALPHRAAVRGEVERGQRGYVLYLPGLAAGLEPSYLAAIRPPATRCIPARLTPVLQPARVARARARTSPGEAGWQAGGRPWEAAFESPDIQAKVWERGRRFALAVEVAPDRVPLGAARFHFQGSGRAPRLAGGLIPLRRVQGPGGERLMGCSDLPFGTADLGQGSWSLTVEAATLDDLGCLDEAQLQTAGAEQLELLDLRPLEPCVYRVRPADGRQQELLAEPGVRWLLEFPLERPLPRPGLPGHKAMSRSQGDTEIHGLTHSEAGRSTPPEPPPRRTGSLAEEDRQGGLSCRGRRPDPRFSFELLRDVPAACARAFREEGLLAPAVGDNDYQRKDKFAALLAAEPWNAACRRLWLQLLPALEQEVRELAERGGWGNALVNVQELAAEEVVFTIRNAQRWLKDWEAAGRPAENDFKGYLLEDLRKKIQRRTDALQRRARPPRTGWGGKDAPHNPLDYCPDPDTAADGEEEADAIELAARLHRLASALRRIDRMRQRCVRLGFGLFPLCPRVAGSQSGDGPWPYAKVALHLRRSASEVSALLAQALQELRDRLAELED